mgnify:CR=1 FL=1
MPTTLLSSVWSRAGMSARNLDDFLHHRALSRSRKALLRLDDHLLRDIGLSRAEAETEAFRQDWDAPANWRG